MVGVLPVLQKMTDREQKRPKMLPVLQFLYDREHLKQYLKRVLRGTFGLSEKIDIRFFRVSDQHFERHIQHLRGPEDRIEIPCLEKNVYILLPYTHLAGELRLAHTTVAEYFHPFFFEYCF